MKYGFLNGSSHHPHSLSRDWQCKLGEAADYIRSTQLDNGAIPWFSGGKLDPWDHVEAAMALSVCGYTQEAEKAYLWLANTQNPDGSWHAKFTLNNGYQGETGIDDLRETNFIAYVATGVWQHYLITRSLRFVEQMHSCVTAAINFIISHQSPHGEIAWAVNAKGVAEDDALLTACSSILRSLDCALSLTTELGRPQPVWHNARHLLLETIQSKPERFDRNWESKARFSMDWYYPVIAGTYTEAQARAHLDQRWSEFVVDGLGCRCVNDEPWVTMAETSELVIALIASGQKNKAEQLFDTLAQWQDNDGGFWTGYVFKDGVVWPEEKTTWTAGAVILAADALYQLSPAASIFTQTPNPNPTELCAL